MRATAGDTSSALPLRECADGQRRGRGARVSDTPLPLPPPDDGVLSAQGDGEPATAPLPRPLPGPQPGVRAEVLCLRLLLTYTALREAGVALSDDLFTDPANRALFLAWRSTEPEALFASLDEDQRTHHGRVLAERMIPYDEGDAAVALQDVAK